MRTITLAVSKNLSRSDVETILQQWSATQGARLKPQGRLVREYKTKGATMHWHITGVRAGMGTVEVTYEPEREKAEVSVHDNRRGTWALSASRDLAKALRLLQRS